MRGLLGLPDRQARRAFALVQRTLDDLGLSALADVRAAALPSGTLRLVELARALCCEPDTLLLDEPASGLDDAETEALHALLRRLAARRLALVIIEHDLALVHEAADVVYVLAGGRVVTSGAPDDVLGRDDVRSLLLGRAP
jgi:branched-chain amino acid transport system ATP-binding protein